jgi:two-component system, OmpR family, sensor kinase
MALTLRSRLTVTTTVATFLAAALLVAALQLLLARQSASDSAGVLQGRLDAAATTVRFGPHGPRVVEMPSRVLDQGLWIYDRTGRRIDGAEPPGKLRPTIVDMRDTSRRAQPTTVGNFRLGSRLVNVPGTQRVGAVIVAAMDLTLYERSEQRDLRLSLLLGLSIVAAAAAASWISAGSSMRHVRQMAHLADDWREHDLSRRFSLGPPRDEHTELAHTLDRMLDRIGHALLTERRLTDEVAHELRTPLAAIRAEAELALSNPSDPAMTAEAFDEIIAGCDRMSASIQTMLSAARSAHAGDQQCHIGETLQQALHLAAPNRIEIHLAPVPVDWTTAAPADVLTAAVTPLLDNALQHAHSRVDLHVEQQPGAFKVIIDDDGPGIPAEHRSHVFDPGWTTRPHGTGLGLPLARRLARSIGGDIEASSSSHGSLVIALPKG